MTITINGTTGISGVDGSSATPAMQGADTNTGISYGTDTVTINTGGVARVTTNASGNVGIGVATPTSKLTVGTGSFSAAASGTSGVYTDSSTGSLVILSDGLTVAARNGVNNLILNSSGNLLVGTNSTPSGSVGGGAFIRESSSRSSLYLASTATSSVNLAAFFNPNGTVGSINTSGSSTFYLTSSDYRLKENVAPMIGALQTVAALKPCTYTWKADGSAGQGFIAHELQEVVPDCVTGEKDAVETVDDLDAEGRKIGTKEVPRYQGVDTSFLVATLVAALQEQQAIISAMETRLAALEA
jgi:hypothetical protein